MQIIDLEQGSPEWLIYRATRIGASDFALFACHKGLSDKIFNIDFNKHIYNKKNNINITNKYMERGKEREPILLADYNRIHNCNCNPVVIQSYKNENIFCSLDGIDFLTFDAVEIKTTASSVVEYRKKRQYYIYQIAHQMYVTELNRIDIYIECSDNVIHEFILKEELPISFDYWYSLCLEYLNILNKKDDDYINTLLLKYEKLDEEIKLLQQEKDDITDILKANSVNGVYGDFIVSNVSRSSYKYAQYIKDNNIELDDKYLTSSNYLTIKKGKKHE